MRKFLATSEIYFVILSLTFFTGALGTIFSSAAIITLIRYLILGISGIAIYIERRKVVYAIRRNIVLSVLTIIIICSFLWSLYPVSTLKDLREVFQMTMFALYFSIRFSVKEQVKFITVTFSIGIVLSILYAVAFPSIGIHGSDHPGAWKGIYDYKNTFGSMMVLSSLLFFSLPVEKPIYKLYKLAGYCVSIVMMLLSTSKTSLVLSFLLIFILLLYKKFRWQGKISVVYVDIAILIFGCVGAFVLTQWVDLLDGLGKDPTLTGRTVIWNYVLSQLLERPLLGFGRGAFWDPQSPYAFAAGRELSSWFRPPHAHNGFIDLMLDVGFIGFLLFLFSFVKTYMRSLKMAYASKNQEDIWPLAFLMFLAMNNITESYLLRLANIYWVLFLTIAISLSIAPKNRN
ncbi:O-antigen polymerase [Nostoc sp. CENA543]|uniref:O-antigen ligase family protein n=1 Tax=Nostoc sp. CENA543 TaxID=1869241 RepID=UPI000CA3170C|nr:O-antigen ligase family protein [Nostoc sp. CENA543]AUT02015.1 O-antigen polymerase [Nostoc sp. CENA543]